MRFAVFTIISFWDVDEFIDAKFNRDEERDVPTASQHLFTYPPTLTLFLLLLRGGYRFSLSGD